MQAHMNVKFERQRLWVLEGKVSLWLRSIVPEFESCSILSHSETLLGSCYWCDLLWYAGAEKLSAALSPHLSSKLRLMDSCREVNTHTTGCFRCEWDSVIAQAWHFTIKLNGSWCSGYDLDLYSWRHDATNRRYAVWLTLRLLMSYIYMKRLFLMFLDHTQRRSTVGRTPLDEW